MLDALKFFDFGGSFESISKEYLAKKEKEVGKKRSRFCFISSMSSLQICILGDHKTFNSIIHMIVVLLIFSMSGLALVVLVTSLILRVSACISFH
ncbi:hypothetical protein MKW98_011380 [Papaver atlanticum]|uniref:Uncharacterized protein n=1 Tax=Papaver atlanticum TaxID=357466 RepID=A0AAD4SX19_9MAGN|nr:hypothetical protein MKW98_011380 [Papaver atlanticum]